MWKGFIKEKLKYNLFYFSYLKTIYHLARYCLQIVNKCYLTYLDDAYLPKQNQAIARPQARPKVSLMVDETFFG